MDKPMTTETNEMIVSNNQELTETPELVIGETIVRQDENFVIVKTTDGKFKRKAKYKHFSSIKAETRQDKIWLSNLMDMNDDDDSAGLKNHIGKQIEVRDIITKPYSKINEETGIEVRTIDREWTVNSAEKHIMKLKRTLLDRPETHGRNVSKSFGMAPEPKKENRRYK